jgi:hypothetical protein
MDGANASTSFIDNSPTPKTVVANGNIQISTAQSKFGGASAYFDGSGDFLQIANNQDFNMGSGDFTIEFWRDIQEESQRNRCDKRELKKESK